MLEMVCEGAIIGMIIALFSSLVFELIDYGSIFWNVKFTIAKYYARKQGNIRIQNKEVSLIQIFTDIIDQANAASYNKRYDIAMAGLEKVAEYQYYFKRWICPICFSGYIGVFAVFAVVGYFGFQGEIENGIAMGFLAYLFNYLFTAIIIRILN